ncbi:MAG: hypothetical protein ACE5H0_03280 [Bacteroidota bacterium]
MNVFRFGVAAVATILFLLPLSAQEKRSHKFSGYMFGDYYYVAANHDSANENLNGFWFRRIYFTYDHVLSEDFAIRLRLELNSPGDFTTSSKIEPFAKDAYLKWKLSDYQILFGLSSTPTWDVIEKIWGYRSVEKTPLDLQKFGSSRDLGIAIKGHLDQRKRVNYHVMFANGAGTKSETNKGKKILGSFGFKPDDSIILEVYGDWEDRGDPTRYTVQGFAAYQTDKARLGVHFASQTRTASGKEDENLEIASVFVAGELSDKVQAFARYDHMFDPAPSGISYIPFDNTAGSSNLIVAGLDYSPANNVHFMPNLEVVIYGENAGGTKPDSDVIPRLTAYYKF